ncbi:hypothetical protein BKP35_14425 [Anaerobacillus arseniciselenatis]|uniref:Dihydrofolate synthase/folylpolyglutamate synthase n=1 Tax=Anaerobacillus arseniciselenatis TaxID=85682 RepID=A0A1S2LCQ7_9BACI|nr:folylpolyglutamate synthase/dihydrofolate synthase family protein [Anaerobacillus arseniciselenatis]OIJ10289.1 hypothetical protein BKP35_14425 [Anaerobacillus arseniciselenatis]
MITYEEACDIVFSAKKFGICLGLERMEAMLKELGHPEQRLLAMHLAGTNGKGSTLTYLQAIFTEAGFSVGTYTSPAIQRINDKIRFNGEEISDEDFAQLTEQLIPVIGKLKGTNLGAPTEFEILTAMAFQYFATIAKPDIVLVETGLGGRLDSTNVIKPLLSIITSIGHDHMDLLGDTISDVTREKAGIIKQRTPIISGCKQEDAKQVIKERCLEEEADLYQLGEEFLCDQNVETFSFMFQQLKYENLKAGMLGAHQQENASLAIMAVHCLKKIRDFHINDDHIRLGITKAKIANRIEVIKQKPTVIFDGGHNQEGIEALSKTLAHTFHNRRIVVLFCAMKDKDIKAMLRPMTDVASEIVLTSFPYERAMDPDLAYEMYPHEKLKVIHEWDQAYEKIVRNLAVDDVFVITGSFYFLNHMRNHLKF